MRTVIAMTGALLVAGACGGPSASAPLEHKVKDDHLAPVPLDQRGALEAAVKDRFLADWQVRYTQYAIGEAKSQVKVAKNDVKKTKLDAKSLKLEKKHATKNAKTVAANLASEQARRNQLELEACRAKVKEARQRVKYLQARLKAERHLLRGSEAKVEMLKARAMASSGVRPPNFDVGKYQEQHQRREKQIQSARAAAQREKQALATLTLKARQCRDKADAEPKAMPQTVPEEAEPAPPAGAGEPPANEPPDAEPAPPAPAEPPPSEEPAPEAEPKLKPKPEPPKEEESPADRGGDPEPTSGSVEDPEEEEEL